jgi:hypothetical protein
MRNPREFFLIARQGWQASRSRIDSPLALERIKKRGGELETEIFHIGGEAQRGYHKIIDALAEQSRQKSGDKSSPTGVSYFLIANYDNLSEEIREALGKLKQLKILFATGFYKALRRQGQKAEMMVLSYPISLVKSIRYLDVVRSMKELHQTEGQIISHHRAQIEL